MADPGIPGGGSINPAGVWGAKPLATKLNVISRLNLGMPKCTTVVQTENDLLEHEIQTIRQKKYNFRPFIGQKIIKSAGIGQLMN